MPTLNKEFLCLLQDDYTKYNIFIETGTYNGSTIFSMESLFASLYTIEISEKYYKNTKQRYTDMKQMLSLPMNNKIKFLLGDSSIVLQYILPTITEKCIIFLDGHWSGDDTGQGDKDCPLIEEITHINELCKMEAIIIIDDCRLFGKGPKNGYNEDWSDINTTKLVGILQDRISKTYSLDTESNKDDRLIIHINAIKSVEDIEQEQRILKEEKDKEDKERILKEEKDKEDKERILKEEKYKEDKERILKEEKYKEDKERILKEEKDKERERILKEEKDKEDKERILKEEKDKERILKEEEEQEKQRILKEEEEQEKQRILDANEKERENEQNERISKAVEIAVSEAKSVLKLQIDTYAEELQILKSVKIEIAKNVDIKEQEDRISRAVKMEVEKSVKKTQQDCCIIS